MAFKTEKYSTSTSIVLVKNENSEKSDTIDQTDINLNQKLVSTYRHIIKSMGAGLIYSEMMELKASYILLWFRHLQSNSQTRTAVTIGNGFFLSCPFCYFQSLAQY